MIWDKRIGKDADNEMQRMRIAGKYDIKIIDYWLLKPQQQDWVSDFLND